MHQLQVGCLQVFFTLLVVHAAYIQMLITLDLCVDKIPKGLCVVGKQMLPEKQLM